ncbi:MAG TPA: hypothetical protein VFV19_07020 [Candidatus Polarisedimenticolaceae bacterium]|nr:hypothetical protein [Candidatus Polarisedimenticolaceae bacterium]
MRGRIACISLALGLAVTAALAADEAATPAGTWSINNWIPGEQVQLDLKQGTSSSRWEWGSSQPLAELKGLTRDQLRATHAEVSFVMVRDAGTFFLTGRSNLGFASGEFRFVGSPDFASKLAALGYETIAQNELLGMAVRGISLDFAAAVKAAGLKDANVADLVRLRDHGVEASTLRALGAAAPGLDVETVLELNDHGVDPTYVRDLAASGNANVGVHDAVRLHDHGVAASFVKGLTANGRPELTVDEILRLHDHGVDPAYVARVSAAGYTGLTVDQIVSLHDHGID